MLALNFLCQPLLPSPAPAELPPEGYVGTEIVDGTEPNPKIMRARRSFDRSIAQDIEPPLLSIRLSCSLNARGTTDMKVTATSFMTTSFDQILSPSGVEGSEAARATRFPIETVAKLKGKDPMSRVMKKGPSGRRSTPEIT